MSNYESINIYYIRDSLEKLFNDKDEVLRPCSIEEVFYISQLLKLKYVSRILYFSIIPLHYSTIHIDKNINTTTSVEFGLNIPVTSGDNIYMNWFEQIADKETNQYSAGLLSTTTPSLDKDNARLVDTMKLNSPTFVRINNWHNIENRSSNNLEKIISIRFNTSKTVDDIKFLLN